jgi:hypothetical protein
MSGPTAEIKYDNDEENNATSANGGGSSNTTQITIQVNTDMTTNAQRFPTWILLCVSSIICVIALQSRRGLLQVDGPGEAWVLSVGSISFLLSFIAIIMYLCCRTIFVSNIPEAVMVRLLSLSLSFCFFLNLHLCA